MSFNSSTVTCSDDFTIQMDECAFEAANINISTVFAGTYGAPYDPECHGIVGGDTVTFSFPFTACETGIESNDTHLIYSNKLNGASTRMVNSVVNRDRTFEFSFRCAFPRNQNVSQAVNITALTQVDLGLDVGMLDIAMSQYECFKKNS